MVRGNEDVARHWFPQKVLDFGGEEFMHVTEKTRGYVKKDSEVVLLVDPASSQVVEIDPETYQPFNELEARCYPKAYPWP